MENHFCQVSNCSEKVEVKCESHSSPSYFCENHYLIHKQDPGDHRLSEQELFTLREINHFVLSDYLKDTFIASFSSSIYIFKIQSVPINLPTDYVSSIEKLIDIFAVKISRIPGGMSEKIGKRVEKFIKALKQIIYNLKVDFISACKQLEEMHNYHQSTLMDNIIEHINTLLNRTITDLKMPPKAKKMFVIEIDLESLRSQFVTKCIEKKEITLNWFWQEILTTYSLFIKEKPANIPNSVKNAFKDYEAALESINAKLIEEVKNFIFSLLITLNYQRVGLFALQITENLNHCRSDWVLFSSLILQAEPIVLSQPVNLAPSSLLFPISMSGETLMILYSDNQQASIIGRIETSSIKIASGSTTDQIFISHTNLHNSCEFFIQMGRLKFRSEIDLKLKFKDKVTSIAYISSQKKLVYIVNNTDIHSKKLDSNKCVAINFKYHDQSLLSLFYSSELGFICVKTKDLLFIFNEHFQIINQLNAFGSQYFGLSIGIYGTLWVYEENKATELKFSLFKTVNDQNILSKAKIIPCKNSMSRDFLFNMPSGSKYTPFVQVKFEVPDFNPDFKPLNKGPYESYLLSPIEFYIEKIEDKGVGSEENYKELEGHVYGEESKEQVSNEYEIIHEENFEVPEAGKVFVAEVEKNFEVTDEQKSNSSDKNKSSSHSGKDSPELIKEDYETESKLVENEYNHLGENQFEPLYNADDVKPNYLDKESNSSYSRRSSSDKYIEVRVPEYKIPDYESSNTHIINSDPFQGINEPESNFSDKYSSHSNKSSSQKFDPENVIELKTDIISSDPFQGINEPESNFSDKYSSHSNKSSQKSDPENVIELKTDVISSDPFQGINEPESNFSDKYSSHSNKSSQKFDPENVIELKTDIISSDPFQGINEPESNFSDKYSSHSNKSSSQKFDPENVIELKTDIISSDPFQGLNEPESKFSDKYSSHSNKSSSQKSDAENEIKLKLSGNELSDPYSKNSDLFQVINKRKASSSVSKSNSSNSRKSSSDDPDSSNKSKTSDSPDSSFSSDSSDNSDKVSENSSKSSSNHKKKSDYKSNPSNYKPNHSKKKSGSQDSPFNPEIPQKVPNYEHFSSENSELIESFPKKFIETEELAPKQEKKDFLIEESKDYIREESKSSESESESWVTDRNKFD